MSYLSISRRSASRPSRCALLLSLLLGCRCSQLEGEVDGQKFMRCAQASPPSERSVRLGPLTIEVQERRLSIDAPRPLTVVTFSGPIGAPLGASDRALLAQTGAGLALYLGGLGETAALAKENLRMMASLRMPTLFVAGGADRLQVIEAAFASLDDDARSFVMHASGLRELRLGEDRFVIVAGAPFGRYAVDEHACGFTAADLEEIQKAATAGNSVRTWLLSWYAPAGFGVSDGFAGIEVGSPDLRALALTLSAKGGIFGYPEAHAGEPAREPFALIAPRLARVGSLRGDGSRMGAGVARVVLAAGGPVSRP